MHIKDIHTQFVYLYVINLHFSRYRMWLKQSCNDIALAFLQPIGSWEHKIYNKWRINDTHLSPNTHPKEDPQDGLCLEWLL